MTEVRFHRVLTVLLAAALLATLTVALTGGQRADAVDGPVEVVYVATGQNFPDALAGANLAATVGAPMLTVNPDLPIPDPTITALQALDPDQIIILGGPVAVSDAVKGALGDYTRSGAVTRIEGGDRHDTAAQIADALPDKVHDADKLDGLDSTHFLRPSDLPAASSIHGARGTTVGTPVLRSSASVDTIRKVEFDAAEAGVVQVTGKVTVGNSAGSSQYITLRLAIDWDGDPGSLTGTHTIDLADHVLSPPPNPGAQETITLTGAAPVTAGPHTVTLLIADGSEDTTRWVADNLVVAFATDGSAMAPGYTSIGP